LRVRTPYDRLRAAKRREEVGYFDTLEEICKARKSLLCIGLDPDIPADTLDPEGAILEENARIIDATAEFAAAFKPNMAFYEAWGSAGYRALEKTLELLPRGSSRIIDAKRSDIGNTAQAYAKGIFGHLGADAVTLSPYMGRDAADPFLAYGEKGVFMLARTSNPSAKAFQDKCYAGSTEPSYVDVAKECLSWGGGVGLVVAGNDYEAMKRLRAAAPGAWFLVPGVGAQGGEAGKALAAGMRRDGFGVLIVVVRAVTRAKDPAAAARAFRDDIERARKDFRG
jgi:uridine monophosphate synthetase